MTVKLFFFLKLFSVALTAQMLVIIRINDDIKAHRPRRDVKADLGAQRRPDSVELSLQI